MRYYSSGRRAFVGPVDGFTPSVCFDSIISRCWWAGHDREQTGPTKSNHGGGASRGFMVVRGVPSDIIPARTGGPGGIDLLRIFQAGRTTKPQTLASEVDPPHASERLIADGSRCRTGFLRPRKASTWVDVVNGAAVGWCAATTSALWFTSLASAEGLAGWVKSVDAYIVPWKSEPRR